MASLLIHIDETCFLISDVQYTKEAFKNPPRFVTCDPENYAPDIDPTKGRVAFGNLAIPKLVSKPLV